MLDLGGQQPLNASEQIAIRLRDQRDRAAGEARATGAAGTVDVIFRNQRQIEVHDQRQLRNVETARRNIRRDEHGHVTGLEIRQRLGAGALALVAMNHGRANTGAFEILAHAIRAVLGLAEHQRLRARRFLQHMRQQIALALIRDRMHAMGHGRRHGLSVRHVHALRRAREIGGQLHDVRRDRRREQQRLPVARQHLEDAPQRRQEAHVEHAVGFVERQDLDAREIDRALLHVIKKPSGGGDNDVGAPEQLFLLRHDRDAAENGGDTQVRGHTVRR